MVIRYIILIGLCLGALNSPGLHAQIVDHGEEGSPDHRTENGKLSYLILGSGFRLSDYDKKYADPNGMDADPYLLIMDGDSVLFRSESSKSTDTLVDFATVVSFWEGDSLKFELRDHDIWNDDEYLYSFFLKEEDLNQGQIDLPLDSTRGGMIQSFALSWPIFAPETTSQSSFQQQTKQRWTLRLPPLAGELPSPLTVRLRYATWDAKGNPKERIIAENSLELSQNPDGKWHLAPMHFYNFGIHSGERLAVEVLYEGVILGGPVYYFFP